MIEHIIDLTSIAEATLQDEYTGVASLDITRLEERGFKLVKKIRGHQGDGIQPGPEYQARVVEEIAEHAEDNVKPYAPYGRHNIDDEILDDDADDLLGSIY